MSEIEKACLSRPSDPDGDWCVKPHRGCLLIDAGTTDDFSFCFSAAQVWGEGDHERISCDGVCAPEFNVHCAAEKQKEREVGVGFGYKQATPLGFGNGVCRHLGSYRTI